MTDRELLSQYASGDDQGAFAELIGRHGNWVYSCAKRLVRQGDVAEDVAQAVFILLAQKAGRLDGRTHLAGWLFRATQYCAGAAMRSRTRRQKHEREAAMWQQMAAGEEGANWEEIWPVLDDAVQKLRPGDREAVLLRFYQGMSVSELAVAIGTGEEAAKKRVQRAVGKLRGMLAKKGVTAGVAALGVVMAEKVTAAAPAGLVEAATEAAIGAAGGGGTGSVGVIAEGAMKAWWLAKVKLGAGIAAAVLVITTGGLLVGSRVMAGTEAPTPAINWNELVAAQDGRWVKLTQIIPNGSSEPMWLSFRPFRMAGHGTNEAITLGQSGGSQLILRDEGAARRTIYDAKTNVITIAPMDTSEPNLAGNFVEWVQGTFNGWKQKHPTEVELTQGERLVDGRSYLSVSAALGNGTRITYLADKQSKRITQIRLGGKGVAEDVPFADVEYAESGPDDIYALGAPKDAKVLNLMPTPAVEELDRTLEKSRAAFPKSYRAIICLTFMNGESGPRTEYLFAVYKNGDRCRIDWWDVTQSISLRERESADRWMREHLPYEVQLLSPRNKDRVRRLVDERNHGGQFNGDYRIESLGWQDAREFRTGARLQAAEDGTILRTAYNGGPSDQWRWYYDPRHDYLCVRHELLESAAAATQPSKVSYSETVTEFAQTAEGKWYPRVRVETGDQGRIRSYTDIYVDTQAVVNERAFDIDRAVAEYKARLKH